MAAGALTAETDITITETADAPPGSAMAYTALFRFEPAGLVFEIPVEVSFAFAGDLSDAMVHWSTDGAEIETLTTGIAGTVASASVDHFSFGWVAGVDGIEDANPYVVEAAAACQQGETESTDNGTQPGDVTVTPWSITGTFTADDPQGADTIVSSQVEFLGRVIEVTNCGEGDFSRLDCTWGAGGAEGETSCPTESAVIVLEDSDGNTSEPYEVAIDP